MALHVDVVENLWSAGRQRRVASAVLIDGQIEVRGDAHWIGLVHAALDEFGELPPERLLEQLADHFKSDYAFASEPHGDACPFGNDDEVTFADAPAGDRRAQPAGA